MHVVVSRFKVANGMTAEVKRAFAARPRLVEQAPGFVRLDVVSPLDDPDEIHLITQWRDRASYDAWHRSHAYRASHAGIPDGIKLVPGATEIRHYEHVCS